jgi:hypothetical protein
MGNSGSMEAILEGEVRGDGEKRKNCGHCCVPGWYL